MPNQPLISVLSISLFTSNSTQVSIITNAIEYYNENCCCAEIFPDLLNSHEEKKTRKINVIKQVVHNELSI